MASGGDLSSVELFSGCGGLALGLARSGFNHKLLVEYNECAVATLAHNRDRGVEHVSHWNLLQSDVRNVSWKEWAGIDLIAGGPPCQPFSIGGKAKGAADRRDMWPEVFRAVAEVQPRAFLFENVRGLTRPRFADYLAHIENTLSRPQTGLSYQVVLQLVNAADFGAAQKRFRLLVCGVHSSIAAQYSFPKPSHSRERLIWEQWVTGEYWREHGLSRSDADIPNGDMPLVRKLRNSMIEPPQKRWVTVRDRLKGLGPPNGLNNHCFQPGARVYPGHTGSSLDQPAKALKAGDHGVPGGENMMVLGDGAVRYFTLRECARLQGLPDDFEFPRSWTESMRQLGNAVPVELSEKVGKSMRDFLRTYGDHLYSEAA
jgi:DNA (cytosine-5)-methyltransferase 1